MTKKEKEVLQQFLFNHNDADTRIFTDKDIEKLYEKCNVQAAEINLKKTKIKRLKNAIKASSNKTIFEFVDKLLVDNELVKFFEDTYSDLTLDFIADTLKP